MSWEGQYLWACSVRHTHAWLNSCIVVSLYNNYGHMIPVRLITVIIAYLEGRKYDRSAVWAGMKNNMWSAQRATSMPALTVTSRYLIHISAVWPHIHMCYKPLVRYLATYRINRSCSSTAVCLVERKDCSVVYVCVYVCARMHVEHMCVCRCT